MQTRNRNPFTTIRTEGALLPVELLQRIVAGDTGLGGLDPESYHLPGSEKLNEAINRSWNRLLGAWATFQTSRGRLSEGDAGTTLTRERWLMPLFQELGYGRLQAAKPVTLEGKEYRVSHAWGEAPIHLVGCGVNLDRRQSGVTGASKSSPHSLVQEFLNRNPNQLWGILSNGLTLRMLRDNASLTRQAYLEFDLEAMLTGEVYADFVVLWLICHQSRVETQEGKPESGWLETWSKAAQEQGTRALDKLRDGVEQAITALGGGFLAHPGNTALKTRLRSGALTREGYYRQLLRLVYRLIFLFAAEDRDLLLDPQATPAARERYLKYYSATHLRHLAEQSRGGRHPDLYATLRLISTILGGREPGGVGSKGLGLPVLGSFLFSAEALPDLETAELENGALLSAVRGLAFVLDGNTRRSVDYRNLGTRELGSVYESLLELHPQINMDAGTFELITAAGNERKTTGSYYTAEDLIKVLLDSALDPVILQAIQRAGPSIEAQIAALLALKVCDPACGSGHFLIAAARRIARRLAQLRSGEEEPSPEITRTALREVIQHCVYGVDINPMSVELCKVNLWLESIEPGKPLSFLEAHIQCGDSLVGVGPRLDISEIPDEAFSPTFGDDKATASALKKRNKAERAGQMGLDIYVIEDKEDLQAWMARRAQSLDELPEETAEQVGQKAHSYQEYLDSPQYRRKNLECDLWTAAFFWKMEAQPKGAGILAPTQEMLRRHRSGGILPPELLRGTEELAERLNFLHWELRFPNVFTGDNPGFNCMLGNPPWERISVKEREFFSTYSQEIYKESNTNVRKQLMAEIFKQNATLQKDFDDSKDTSLRVKKFLSQSSRFPLTGVGDINTYALFPELFLALLSNQGYAGVVTQTQLVTEKTYSGFLRHLIQHQKLVSCYAFENERFLFPAAHHSTRFVLITIGGNNPVFHAATALWLVEWLKQKERIYRLTSKDIKYLNPETGSIPQFRTNQDFALAQKVYSSCENLKNDTDFRTGISSSRVMHDTDDATVMVWDLRIAEQDKLLPVLESKMFDQYNHRLSTYEGVTADDIKKGYPRDVEESELRNPFFSSQPRKWVNITNTPPRFADFNLAWQLHIRKITNSIAFRTVVCTVTPKWPNNGSAWWIRNDAFSTRDYLFLLAVLNSLPLDYFARQKVGGINLNSYHLNQFPIPIFPSERFNPLHETLIYNAFELSYTAMDLAGLAIDFGYVDRSNQVKMPFKWDAERRSHLSCEIDAIVARLYGFTRDELSYIIDPQDVYGPDFPGETFRVLKEKELKQYGEYRTRRLVLEAWDRLEKIQQAEETASPIPIDLSIKVAIPHPELEVNWLPAVPNDRPLKPNDLSATYRQAVGVAWCLDRFGTGQSIPLFDAQKYNYFLQRANLADLDIPYREFAKGPYSPQVTYKAGSYAKSKSFWEVRGTNVVRGRKLKDAVDAAPRVIVDIEQAQSMIQRLAQISKDDLGGLATVDFSSRAIFERGQVITPETIRAYFQSDWPEKAGDGWYTDENITRALEMLADLGLFKKAGSEQVQTPAVNETLSENRPSAKKRQKPDDKRQTNPIEQPTLSDFGLYKCGVCGKMVMGFEKEVHERDKHSGKSVEWKKMRGGDDW